MHPELVKIMLSTSRLLNNYKAQLAGSIKKNNMALNYIKELEI